MERFGRCDPGIIERNKMYKLQRYDIGALSDELFVFENDTDGDWVRWSHVEPLLKAYLELKNGQKISR